MPERPVTEARLHRIYTNAAPESVRDEIDGIFDSTNRLGDIEDRARAEGFVAGLFMGTTLNMNTEVMDTTEAIEYLEDNNPYDEYPSRGGFVSIPDEDYGNHDIYVASPRSDVDDYDVPDGWTGKRARDNVGLVFRKETPSVPDPNEFERADANINEDELDHDVDIDGDQIIRELDGVETAEAAVDWINDNEGTKAVAHVSGKGPNELNPYVMSSVEELPRGWKRCDGNNGYLVKA